MKRHLLLVTSLACAIGLAVGGRCHCQNPSQPGYPGSPTVGGYPGSLRPAGYPRAPALSPYLNLLNGGSPSANYFLGVIPEFQRRAAYNQLNNVLQDLNQPAGSLPGAGQSTDVLSTTIGTTGHATAFGYYGSYYSFGSRARASLNPANEASQAGRPPMGGGNKIVRNPAVTGTGR